MKVRYSTTASEAILTATRFNEPSVSMPLCRFARKDVDGYPMVQVFWIKPEGMVDAPFLPIIITDSKVRLMFNGVCIREGDQFLMVLR